MSQPLPQVSGHAVVSALSRAGFAQISQRGSHVKLRSEDGLTVIVPMHRELAPGTLRSIIRQSNLDVDRFVSLLR